MYNFLYGVLYVRCLALCPIIFCYSTRNRSHLLFQHTSFHSWFLCAVFFILIFTMCLGIVVSGNLSQYIHFLPFFCFKRSFFRCWLQYSKHVCFSPVYMYLLFYIQFMVVFFLNSTIFPHFPSKTMCEPFLFNRTVEALICVVVYGTCKLYANPYIVNISEYTCKRQKVKIPKDMQNEHYQPVLSWIKYECSECNSFV